MSKTTLFTKIIDGEIPSHKVYEDEKTYVLMDIHPIQPGQVLVVPKHPADFVWDLDDEDYVALMRTVKLVGERLRAVFSDADRVGVIIEGLDVGDHAHVKVFPFSNDEQFRHIPDGDSEPDHAALASIAQKLQF